MSSIRLALASLLLSLAACFPSPQPSAPASSAAPSDDPQIVASCQQSTSTMLAECSKPLDPALSREDVRSGVDTYKQILAGLTYCKPEAKAPLEQCIAGREAALATWDPDADTRRAEAGPRADKVRGGADYRGHVERLQLSAEHARVVCEDKDAGPASARACTAANADFAAAQDTLRAYLLEQGFDARDLKTLSLLPTV